MPLPYKLRNAGFALGLAALAVGLVLWENPAPIAAQPGPKPSSELPVKTSDLALIPANAGGFVHVQVAKVWKTDSMKDVRKIAERAGPKAFAALEEFKPSPSTLERVTVVLLPVKTPRPEDLKMVTILSFSEPFVADDVRKLYLSKATEKKVEGKTYFADEVQGVSVHFADNRTLIFGDAETLPAYLKMPLNTAGPLKDAVDAHVGKAMFACVNLREIGFLGELEGEIPAEMRPLLKAEYLTLFAEFEKAVTVHVHLAFESDDAAKAGDAALRKAADFARVQLDKPRKELEREIFGRDPKKSGDLDQLMKAVLSVGGLGGLNTVDEILAELPVVREGKTLALKYKLPEWVTPYAGVAMVGAGVALPGIQKMRNAAARSQSQNNLKQIALAMHNYHDTHNAFPPAAICDKKGKKLLSWRVAILPYIEQDNVYKQFKLDEPWDSEHNKKFSDLRIKTYMDPRLPNDTGNTHYKVFVGKESAFDWLQSKSIPGISDGTSNTIMVVAAGDAVPWAKPEDFEFDSEKPLPDLTKPFPQLLTAFCDGSVRTINPQMKDFDKIMKIIIGASDGIVTPDF